MNILSLKEYAEQKNVTYEAVRQQVNRYKDDLGSHIIRDGRQQFLDEVAVAFLDEKRERNPVVVVQQSKDDEIERLERENKNLQIKITEQADKIANLAEWKAEKALQIAQVEQQTLLLEEKTKLAVAAAVQEVKNQSEDDKREAVRAAEERIARELSEKYQKEVEELQSKLKQAENELDQERGKSIWQRLFGK